MTVRRLVTAASTFVVAIVLAICVPVTQLRTESTRSECCCPDPDHCKCPDHKADGTQSTMRACHKTTQQFVSPVLPEFVPPEPELAHVSQPAVTEVVFVHGVPHAPPAPPRPAAPS